MITTVQKKKGNWDDKKKTQLLGCMAICCFLCYIEILQRILIFPWPWCSKTILILWTPHVLLPIEKQYPCSGKEWFTNFKIFPKNQVWVFHISLSCIYFLFHELCFYPCCILSLISLALNFSYSSKFLE